MAGNINFSDSIKHLIYLIKNKILTIDNILGVERNRTKNLNRINQESLLEASIVILVRSIVEQDGVWDHKPI